MILSVVSFHLKAQENNAPSTTVADTCQYDTSMSRPVTGIYSFEIGGTSVMATYLTPLKYSGRRYAITGNWSKAMPFNPTHAIMEFNATANISNLLNPAKTARMIGMTASFSWGMSWRTKFTNDFQITAGGFTDISGGAYYLLRNGNNPVQAIANVSLGISGSLSKPFTIGKLPVLITESLQIPSVSCFFNQGYGETYFEIYLGNTRGLAHAGWWGNNFHLNNLLSVVLDFGRTSLQLGYRFETYNQNACHLHTRITSNSFVIGVIPGGIGLKKKTKRLPSETVYAIY